MNQFFNLRLSKKRFKYISILYIMSDILLILVLSLCGIFCSFFVICAILSCRIYNETIEENE
jgi:hypothetical protein